MKWVNRILLGCLAVMLAAAGYYYFSTARNRYHTPFEVFFLEAQMTHLAWRVQQGLPLYPDWSKPPHDANVFGPVYFWIVGSLGRVIRADLDELTRIGRSVSFAAGLASALMVSLCVRKFHWSSVVVAFLVAVTPTPADRFTTMVRSDSLAEMFGLAGFLLVVARSGLAVFPGAAFLAAAALTRQTCLVFTAAGLVALALEHRWRRATIVAAMTAAMLAGSIVAIQRNWEPRLLQDMLLESSSPLDFHQWRVIVERLCTSAPHLVVLPLLLVGVALCTRSMNSDESRDLRRWASFGAVLLLASGIAAAKLGSDLNYFLSLRLVAAWAAGWLWALAMQRQPSWKSSLIVAAACGVFAAPLYCCRTTAIASRGPADPENNAYQSDRLRGVREGLNLVNRSGARLLTDSAFLAMHQREHAAFVDPFLFRLLVVTGRLDPKEIAAKLSRKEYDYIVTTTELFGDGYDSHVFGLPPKLAAAARQNYQSFRNLPGFRVYVPK